MKRLLAVAFDCGFGRDSDACGPPGHTGQLQTPLDFRRPQHCYPAQIHDENTSAFIDFPAECTGTNNSFTIFNPRVLLLVLTMAPITSYRLLYDNLPLKSRRNNPSNYRLADLKICVEKRAQKEYYQFLSLSTSALDHSSSKPERKHSV